MKIWAVEFSDWEEGPYIVEGKVYATEAAAKVAYDRLEAEALALNKSGGYSVEEYEVVD